MLAAVALLAATVLFFLAAWDIDSRVLWLGGALAALGLLLLWLEAP